METKLQLSTILSILNFNILYKYCTYIGIKYKCIILQSNLLLLSFYNK